MWYKKCNLEILHVGLKIKLVLHQHRHFHPSGRVTPSTEDILLTKKMVICGEFLDIPVIDHVIVGGRTGEIYSFQKNEMITSKQLSDSLDELNSREYYER